MYKINIDVKGKLLTFITERFNFEDQRIIFYDKYNKYKNYHKDSVISIEEVGGGNHG